MKKCCLFWCIILAVNVQAQHFWPGQLGLHSWIRLDIRPRSDPSSDAYWDVYGGVSPEELAMVGLGSVGSGRDDYGYFEFFDNMAHCAWCHWYAYWQPAPIPPNMVWLRATDFRNDRYEWHHGFCNCDCPGSLDSLFISDSFGFWYDDPYVDNCEWCGYGINTGYTVWAHQMMPWYKIPCPPAGPMPPKPGPDPVSFTDSLWNPLDDGAVLCGDSKLYVKATVSEGVEALELTFYLESSPDSTIDVEMEGTPPGSGIFHATLENSRILGLKSYNTVIAKTTWPGPDTTTWGRDNVDVALPVVEIAPLPGIPTIYNDTIFIDHETMMLQSDIGIRLRLRHDGSGNEISPDGLVDSAGYKYKSRWTANANLPPSQQKKYFRHYPADDSYLWWDGARGNCQVDIFRWNLYAVGGELTLEAIGALNPVPNINNSFHEVTDSIPDGGDSIKTKVVLIDNDPVNTLFLDSLQYDIIKATAWKEGAGSLGYPPHQAQAKLSHYWNDTHTPCENGNSTATGIMQMLRTTWDDCFAGLMPDEPLGYTQCNWDSVAWNWKVNIHNGKYIFFVNNYHHINLPNNPQRNWDSLYFPESNYTPDTRNKEDLSAYGYKLGAKEMKKIITQSDWDNKVKIFGDVVNTRKYKHERPWQ